MSAFLNTLKLLRFPFSLFLLPITLFSFFYIRPEVNYQLLLLLGIWHILVFPASNGYNSYNDRDDGPIGGLSAPPKPTKALLYIANLLDAAAVLLSLFINYYFSLFVLFYIMASRLYSYRKVRLKKLPVIGFLVVIIFQGAWVFTANIFALSKPGLFSDPAVIFAMIASSFFIGTIYPLTQIYQHDADKKDGVKTLSILLGLKSTFIFSGVMFLIATLFIFLSFRANNLMINFWIFNMVMLPATVYFITWSIRSFQNMAHINFKNTMIMLTLSSLLNNIYFLILLIK